MEYMFTHRKIEPSQICQENKQYWVPNRHLLHKNGPPHQTYIRTNWPKWPITTLCARKQSSTIDTHQNQLAKCSNDIQCSQTVLNGRHPSEPTVKCSKSTLCSKEKFAQVHTDVLTWVWSLSACPGACFHSTKEMCMSAAGAKHRRLIWILETNGIPQSSLLGPVGLEQWVPRSHPGHHGHILIGENAGRPASREHSLTLGAKVY